MRVTQGMLTNNFLRNLNTSMRSLEQLQNQLATGKKINKPSDDPVVAVRSLQFNSELNQLNQYKRNADTAIKWMDTTDSAIQEANNIFKTLREKLVQGANGTLDEESRKAIAREIEQLKEHLGSIANTSIAGRYIFAGTDTLTAPYQNGNFVNTNQDTISVELGKGIMIDINVRGIDLFGFQDPGTGNNIFEFLDSAITTLEDPNGDVNPLLDQLTVYENNFLSVHTSLGANQNRVELIQNRLDDQVLSTTKLLSQEEDVDVAKVITDMNMQENVHRLALGTGARIMQPTLMDFLR